MSVEPLLKIICSHINKEALSAARTNAAAGLFYNVSMSSDWKHVDSQIAVHDELLKTLITFGLGNKRVDLMMALDKFDALQQNVLFDRDDEMAVNSTRNQAVGIKLMLTRINKKKHNMVNGTRSKSVFKALLSDPEIGEPMKGSPGSSLRLSPVASECSEDDRPYYLKHFLCLSLTIMCICDMLIY
jgi:hypothetical protein